MSNLRGASVLVTGAAGFIGSHLLESLLQAGARPRAFVRYNSAGSRGWLDRLPAVAECEIVAGDIRDRESVARAARGVTHIFHLAALIGIPYSYEAPDSYVATNITGTLNVLQAARAEEVERVIVTSTSEVYGTARRVPIDEEHPLQGQSPYSASKIGADKLAESFHLSFGLPVVTVRPFNTYGPRQSARAIVPTIVSQCLAGSIVRLGNVHPTRDLTYVEDIADGFIRAAGVPEAVGRTINLGSGREISIEALTHAIGRLVGRPVSIESESLRQRPAASEVERLLADNTAARDLLGWTPSVALEEGLERTIRWIEANLSLFRQGQYAV